MQYLPKGRIIKAVYDGGDKIDSLMGEQRTYIFQSEDEITAISTNPIERIYPLTKTDCALPMIVLDFTPLTVIYLTYTPLSCTLDYLKLFKSSA